MIPAHSKEADNMKKRIRQATRTVSRWLGFASWPYIDALPYTLYVAATTRSPHIWEIAHRMTARPPSSVLAGNRPNAPVGLFALRPKVRKNYRRAGASQVAV